MKVGIIGLQGVGKTTIFNSLTGHMIHSDSTGSKKVCGMGITKVPDKRIDTLAALFRPKRTVYAQIQFIDFPGSTEDKKGFSDQTLRKLNEVDALALVLKGFSFGIPATPVEDLRNILADMLLSDLLLAERSVEKLEKDRRNPRLLEVMKKIHKHLSEDACVRLLHLEEHEEDMMIGYAFVTRKPLLVVVNRGEGESDLHESKIQEICTEQGWRYLSICGTMEEEIAQLNQEEQGAFLEDLGVAEPARDRFIRASYALLNLISFFTVGDDEVRSWPVPSGIKAQKAAGKIHTDIERGFIRAEVIGYDTFIECGDLQAARKKGFLRLEGKEYHVQDGDIITFRFNV